jgi:CRISPR system Cascade subunit CasE
MYLSRLILNPRNRRAQREIANPYQMHRSLMRAFPDDLKEGDERVLFRLEPGRNGAPALLVQSWTLPDWSWLAEPGARDYLWTNDELNPATKPFDLKLAASQVLAFRLRANPTARRRLPDGTRKRIGLCREEDQIDWLQRKGKQGGFQVISVHTSRRETIKGSKGQGKGQYTLLSVQFDGLLQVTDPDRLRETVRQGIGSAKGFGFGLLSLARPQGYE